LNATIFRLDQTDYSSEIYIIWRNILENGSTQGESWSGSSRARQDGCWARTIEVLGGAISQLRWEGVHPVQGTQELGIRIFWLPASLP